jgi:hypothetical protein
MILKVDVSEGSKMLYIILMNSLSFPSHKNKILLLLLTKSLSFPQHQSKISTLGILGSLSLPNRSIKPEPSFPELLNRGRPRHRARASLLLHNEKLTVVGGESII